MSRPEPEPKYVLRDGSSHVTACAFHNSDEGLLLLTGSSEGVIKVWQMKSMRASDMVEGHGKCSVLAIVTLSYECVLSQGRDGTVKLWKLDKGKLALLCSYPSSNIAFCQCCCYKKNDKEFQLAIPSALTQSNIEILKICNYEVSDENKRILKVPSNLGMTMAMKFLSVNRLVTGHESGSLVLWDTDRCQQLSDTKLHQEPVMCIDYSHDMGKGLTGSADKFIACWKITDEDKLDMVQKIEMTNPGLNSIRIRNDEKIFATAGWDNRIRVFSFKKLTPLAVLTFHRDSVQCIGFSNCGTMVATSKDGQMTFWDIYNR